jgi:hypothetical protein
MREEEQRTWTQQEREHRNAIDVETVDTTQVTVGQLQQYVTIVGKKGILEAVAGVQGKICLFSETNSPKEVWVSSERNELVKQPPLMKIA